MAPPTNEERIEQLLDQLQAQSLSIADIEKIQSKIAYLKSLSE